MATQNGKLLMTFDCLNTKSNLSNAFLTAKAFSKNLNWEPQAVSVVAPSEVNWPSNFTVPWVDEFEKLGQDAQVKFLKRNHADTKLSSRVLLQPYLSSKENVRLIVKEATKVKASAIAVFTHAHRAGFTLPGSFITSLIYESSVPILAVNTKAPVSKSIKKIVFATDFSPDGAKAFRTSITMAKKLGAEIVLLHILSTNFNETMAASVEVAGGWANVESYLKDEERRVRAKGKQWLGRAAAQGVKGTLEINNNSYSTPNSILDSAKRHRADLIVVTQRVGRWSSYVLGSVTRDVIAKSLLPILIVPSRAVQPKTKKKGSKK